MKPFHNLPTIVTLTSNAGQLTQRKYASQNIAGTKASLDPAVWSRKKQKQKKGIADPKCNAVSVYHRVMQGKPSVFDWREAPMRSMIEKPRKGSNEIRTLRPDAARV